MTVSRPQKDSPHAPGLGGGTALRPSGFAASWGINRTARRVGIGPAFTKRNPSLHQFTISSKTART